MRVFDSSTFFALFNFILTITWAKNPFQCSINEYCRISHSDNNLPEAVKESNVEAPSSTSESTDDTSSTDYVSAERTASFQDKESIETASSFRSQETAVPISTPQNDIPGEIVSKKTNRFNHANFDCGSLILATNKEAKDATNILVKSKDQYMLNVCK